MLHNLLTQKFAPAGSSNITKTCYELRRAPNLNYYSVKRKRRASTRKSLFLIKTNKVASNATASVTSFKIKFTYQVEIKNSHI